MDTLIIHINSPIGYDVKWDKKEEGGIEDGGGKEGRETKAGEDGVARLEEEAVKVKLKDNEY